MSVMQDNFFRGFKRKTGIRKPKTRRHLGFRKFTGTNAMGETVSKWMLSNKSMSVFSSPPKPKLLLDPKFSRAILVS